MRAITLLFCSLVYFSLTNSFAAEAEFRDNEIIHLLQDQPMYFLMGPPETKVQISLKMKAFKETDLYLAYTQKIFWDLFEKSSPFRDINYNPSIFYRFRFGEDSHSLLDILGFEHESNGRGSSISRSWDRTGARFQSMQRLSGDMKLEWGVRAWVPFNLDHTNADIAEYRGIYEITLTLSNFLGPYFDLNDLILRIYPGGKFYINPLQGGQELTFRFKGKTVGFLANAVFQVFQGYGENMLEYNHRVFGLRAGIGI